MTTKLLFLCPHNAAKSVAAAAYVSRLGEQAGLSLSASTAGTHPDAEVLGLVRDQLESEGFLVDSVPRTVRASDLEEADHIINIGCSYDELPTSKTVIDWEIPNFSDDPDSAFGALREHAAVFVSSLD